MDNTLTGGGSTKSPRLKGSRTYISYFGSILGISLGISRSLPLTSVIYLGVSGKMQEWQDGWMDEVEWMVNSKSKMVVRWRYSGAWCWSSSIP